MTRRTRRRGFRRLILSPSLRHYQKLARPLPVRRRPYFDHGMAALTKLATSQLDPAVFRVAAARPRVCLAGRPSEYSRQIGSYPGNPRIILFACAKWPPSFRHLDWKARRPREARDEAAGGASIPWRRPRCTRIRREPSQPRALRPIRAWRDRWASAVIREWSLPQTTPPRCLDQYRKGAFLWRRGTIADAGRWLCARAGAWSARSRLA